MVALHLYSPRDPVTHPFRDANVGASSHDEILKRIGQYKDKGITLSTVGFGDGNYKDTMMEQLANKGDGNYSYIDSQAQRIVETKPIWRIVETKPI